MYWHTDSGWGARPVFGLAGWYIPVLGSSIFWSVKKMRTWNNGPPGVDGFRRASADTLIGDFY